MDPNQPFNFDIKPEEIKDLKKIQKLLNNKKFLPVINEGRKARNKYPKNYFFYTIPSIAYSLINRHEDVFKLLKEAEQRFPDSYEVFYQLAKVYEDLEDYEEAEKCFKKSYEVTPEAYNDARAECLNDLGVINWIMHRKKEALELWKDALKEDPKNLLAQNNLSDFTNEYGEPAAISPKMDDLFHFQNIQLEKYFRSKNESTFKSKEETNRILQLISDAYNRKIASKKERLDSSTAIEKTKWFKRIKIDFESKPMSKDENLKLFKSMQTKTSKKSKSKKRMEKPQKEPALTLIQGKKFPQDEKPLSDFKSKFPFLPEDGLVSISIATPFLFSAGYELERILEILDDGVHDEDEKTMILWAYDIGSNLFKSVTEEDEEAAEDFYYNAIDIAYDLLDEDEIEEAYKFSMKALNKLADELE